MERFESGQKNAEVAAALRISVRSVERWRRAWREGGEAGVLSKGSPGRPRLNKVQVVRLERELERGPLAHGWTDQRWTLARIKTLIGRLFHVSHTVEGTWRLLKRHGWSWQQPTRRVNSSMVAMKAACHHPVKFPNHMSALTNGSRSSDGSSGSTRSTWYLCQPAISVATVTNANQTSIAHVHRASLPGVASLPRIPYLRKLRLCGHSAGRKGCWRVLPTLRLLHHGS
ncbi:winged helix-turn-helix domain-containing protein [Streptomyces sp. NPDC059215]|uniref:winged helix-turn-helix domain-containing protein n=1 Tax=Streptomyces sp. NPDC059215 TaxID=3346772 RepID=UPI003693607C